MAETLSLSTRLAEEFASGAADLNRPAELAGIPSPGFDVESLVKSVRALKQVVDQFTGNSGSVLDKAPTLREMLVDGTVVYAPSAGLSAGLSATGYSDPRPALTTPPTITNLEAFGAFKNVILTWDMTDYRNHAFVEIWRSVGVGNNNLGAATQIDTSTANLFADADVVVGQTYYYWVRAVNIEGAIGAYNAVPGVEGALLKIGTTDLGALVVEAANLATDAVTSVKIQDNAIIAGKLAANSIAVGTAAIQNGAIVNAMIANLAVDNAKIADLSAAKINAGTLDAARIAAGSLDSNKITAGTITADRMVAGLMSADNVLTRGLTVRDGSGNVILASGTPLTQANADGTLRNDYVPTGINLIYNSAFEAGLGGWSINGSIVTWGYGVNYNTSWRLLPTTAPWTSVFFIEQVGGPMLTTAYDYMQANSTQIPVAPNARYVLSAHLAPHRCIGTAFLTFYTSAGALISTGDAWAEYNNIANVGNVNTLDKFARVSNVATAPSNAAYCTVTIRKWATNDADIGSGSSYLWATRVQLEQVPANASLPSAWSDGARQHTITAGNASTYIASLAVGTLQIADAAVTDAFLAENYGTVSLPAGATTTVIGVDVTQPAGSSWNGEIAFCGELYRAAYNTAQIGITVGLWARQVSGGTWSQFAAHAQSFPPTTSTFDAMVYAASHWNTTLPVGTAINRVEVRITMPGVVAGGVYRPQISVRTYKK